MNRKLRFGMVGGGRGAFIGAVHRLAAQMDGAAELVAGAFSSDPGRSQASGRDLLLDPARVYGSYAAMAAAEAALPADRRLDFVVIVTPNHAHFPPAKLFLESGFNVVCDKPVTYNLAEAKALKAIVTKTGKVFVLTHNYTGNAMVKQARALVRENRLGAIRKILVEYSPRAGSRRASRPAARNKRPGAPTRSVAAPRAASATSGRTPRISPATSPASTSSRSAPTSRRSSRAASSTTTAAFSCVTAAARKACCTPRRSASATRTPSTSASTASGRRSSGSRSGPTNSS
jgi:hypothetical protein